MFEYNRIIVFDDELDSTLHNAGSAGWELVVMIEGSFKDGNYMLIFKRKFPEPKIDFAFAKPSR